MYSFCNYVETPEEENDSLRKLREVLRIDFESQVVTRALVEYTEEFVVTKFIPSLPKLCLRYSKNFFFGWLADNCFVESENSALVRDPMGPKPNYKLHVSTSSIIQHTNSRMHSLNHWAHQESSSTFLRKLTESEVESMSGHMSTWVIEKSNHTLVSQWSSSNGYNHMLVSSNHNVQEFLVRYPLTHHSQVGHRRPKYSRTRVVTFRRQVVDGHPQVIAKCSCC